MSYWKLKVENFGKIKHAEIELAPMTLFVGDNNSGKSYLLSLVWAIYGLSGRTVFSYGAISNFDSEEYRAIEAVLLEAIDQLSCDGNVMVNVQNISKLVEKIINQLMERYKDQFVKKIFNCELVEVSRISLTMPEHVPGNIIFTRSQSNLIFQCMNTQKVYLGFWDNDSDQLQKRRSAVKAFVADLICNLIGTADVDQNPSDKGMVYLPSARTGFMMTKDIINKFARRNTYDIGLESTDRVQIQPFSQPIIDFLDELNDLSDEENTVEDYQKISSFLQQYMIQGKIVMSHLPGKELAYMPEGQSKKYPFRATSAVVTELSPLFLLLAHKRKLSGIFYEEPEMCLHPSLQRRMGQVLIKMVHAGINVTATTHSDIILQHINNMIRLQNSGKNPEDYGYDNSDFLSEKQVRVYQLSNCTDGMTEVKELHGSEKGFAVPTFNDALDDLMDEVIQIQE